MDEKIVKDSQGLVKDLVNDTISRQAAVDIVRFECGEWEGLAKTIIKRFEQLPSAQPEIIRCKDCKWSDWYDAADGHRYCYCMETGAAGRTADDYCSYAERMEVSE